MEGLFRLGAHDVHVWWTWLDLPHHVLSRLESTLSPEEASQARRFHFTADRERYVVTHGFLRVLLSNYLDTSPRRVAVFTAPGGKPRVAGRRSLRFSLSHAATIGIVAVSADREVGIDLEQIREIDDPAGLAETCFSAAEAATLAGLPESQRLRAFFAGWTRKEAFLKATGDGLSRSLSSFDVSLPPDEPPRLLHVHGDPRAPERYWLMALEPAAGYVGALAVDGRPATIRCHRGDAPALLEDVDGQ
jgi:4'-phosphopantetheinyl transferase